MPNRPLLPGTPHSSSEQVLCVPTDLFHELGVFQGYYPSLFNWQGRSYLHELLSPADVSWIARKDCELDPNFKQIIPYITIKCGNTVLRYRRTKAGGEGRLRGLYSIGLGGHISLELDGKWLLSQTLLRAMHRELDEEVRIDGEIARCYPAGLINDDSTDVGKVHLGVHMVVEVKVPCVYPKNEEACEMQFLSADTVSGTAGGVGFEGWSTVALGGGARSHWMADPVYKLLGMSFNLGEAGK